MSYVDDLKLFISINSIQDCQLLQDAIKSSFRWYAQNRLLATFSRKKDQLLYMYNADNASLTRCNKIKDLFLTQD